MKFGIARLLAEPALRAPVRGKCVALVAHSASVTQDLSYSLDALAVCGDIKQFAAFGPAAWSARREAEQHDRVGTLHDLLHGIPIFSLYGDVRKPTDETMDTFDVVLFDL